MKVNIFKFSNKLHPVYPRKWNIGLGKWDTRHGDVKCLTCAPWSYFRKFKKKKVKKQPCCLTLFIRAINCLRIVSNLLVSFLENIDGLGNSQANSFNDDERKTNALVENIIPWRIWLKVSTSLNDPWNQLRYIKWMNKRADGRTAYVPTEVIGDLK